MFLFKGRAIEAAEEFQARAFVDWFEGAETLFEGAHVRQAPGAEIEDGFSAVGDDVGARAAGYDVRVDGDAAAKVVPLFDTRDLRSEFVDGVYTFFGCQARVGGAAVDDEFRFADAFAGRF